MGIRKSWLKKLWPISLLFNWRDHNLYRKAYNLIGAENKINRISNSECQVNIRLNNRLVHLVFRKFPYSDLSVLHQIFIQGCYLPLMNKIKEYYPNDYPLKIVDVGANVGFSILYFKMFFQNSRIIGIEPENANCSQISKNLEINDFYLEELIQGGLWHSKTDLILERNFRDNREAAFTVKESSIKTSLHGHTLSDILLTNKWSEVDLLKIDIEGGERFLLNTSAKARLIFEKAKFIAIEIHDEFKIRELIYSYLKENDFEHFEFNDLTIAFNARRIKSSLSSFE